jgi:hypothetical protein
MRAKTNQVTMIERNTMLSHALETMPPIAALPDRIIYDRVDVLEVGRRPAVRILLTSTIAVLDDAHGQGVPPPQLFLDDIRGDKTPLVQESRRICLFLPRFPLQSAWREQAYFTARERKQQVSRDSELLTG